MNFTPIDFARWPRREVFAYFSRMAPTGYSLTVDLDATILRRTLKEADVKLFPVYLWLVTRNLNRQEAFRLAEQDGQLGTFDSLTPLYAAFHPDDETFSLMWTEYDPDLRRFCQAYLADQRQYGHIHGILAKPGLPPANAYTVSCVPWISFRHFAVHSCREQSYYFPSVESGKLREAGGKVCLPLSITCHHAAADGIHVARFLDDLQADMDGIAAFL